MVAVCAWTRGFETSRLLAGLSLLSLTATVLPAFEVEAVVKAGTRADLARERREFWGAAMAREDCFPWFRGLVTDVCVRIYREIILDDARTVCLRGVVCCGAVVGFRLSVEPRDEAVEVNNS